ncbi:MAG: diguanylate cyclase [Myxococcaceae bacterium]
MGAPVLLVDSDPPQRLLTEQTLLSAGIGSVMADSSAAALHLAQGQRYPAIIASANLPDSDVKIFAEQLRDIDPEQEILILGAEDTIVLGVGGPVENLARPIEPTALRQWVSRAIERSALRAEASRLRGENLELERSRTIHQRCLEFLVNPDLEWLQERVLQELGSVCDAQSAALFLSDERGQLSLRAYRGFFDRRDLPEQLRPEDVVLERLSQGAPWFLGEGTNRALWMPLRYAGEVLGVAQLADPLGGDFRGDNVRDAKVMAEFAAVAFRNARRFMALARQGLRDRDTAAYNLSYFTDYSVKEIYKARRYGRAFALVTFSIDNLPQLKARLGADETRRATRGLTRAIQRVIRDSDVLARVSDGELYLILPETDFFGALTFGRRAVMAAQEDPDIQAIESRVPLAMVQGASAFPRDGDDFDDLVHRCRQRMDASRVSLHRKLLLEALSFWEEVDLLMGNSHSPALPHEERGEPSRRGKVAVHLFEDLQTEIARDLLRDASARGLLYVGLTEVRADLPLLAMLREAPEDLAARVYLLGRRGEIESHPVVTPVFASSDERLGRCEFILWLTENAAYALLQRRGHGTAWGFHTSDSSVVESLVSKLQAEYDLQPY